ncbi:MAG: DUF883 family protein [Methylobacteriaceae bacterium]|nr:DUF883 family protein [Methylobacteriaceae bacterium]MBV9635004.1 DUF883 family protein [Methylobacteriaceae bacterium]MBV9702604.1 DUF883 family protein [Methylobacteriaceae bacterium]
MSDYDTKIRDNSAPTTAADFNDLRNDIAKLTETVTSLVKGQADAASATVMEALDTAKGSIATTAAEAGDRVTTLGTELEATIERNPLTSVLVALGIGLMAGMMTSARR